MVKVYKSQFCLVAELKFNYKILLAEEHILQSLVVEENIYIYFIDCNTDI